MTKGKAYANKRTKEERPIGDFYNTPKSLVWVAKDIIKKEFPSTKHPGIMDDESLFNETILEPAAGQRFRPIVDVLKKDYVINPSDLYDEDPKNRFDYLDPLSGIGYSYCITNPPFSLWDDFVNKAKTHCKKFMFIGRLNYFGTNSRFKSNIWGNLKWVMPFNRYVDYQTPYRLDGLFHVGAMATGWFIWEKGYTNLPMLQILDIQKYAKLGQFNKEKI